MSLMSRTTRSASTISVPAMNWTVPSSRANRAALRFACRNWLGPVLTKPGQSLESLKYGADAVSEVLRDSPAGSCSSPMSKKESFQLRRIARSQAVCRWASASYNIRGDSRSEG